MYEGVYSIYQAQDRDQWQAVVDTVMNTEFHNRWGIFWQAERLLVCKEGFCSLNSVS
jgi:hypothetical protein